MANLQDIYLKKARAQRENIRKLLEVGTGAILEMPNHDVPFPINIKWLETHGIKVSIEKDRDGRPITLIDTSRVLQMPDRMIQAYVEEGLSPEGAR